jgi:sulfatase maturation enzyme AslB (radical SAM superfamily)
VLRLNDWGVLSPKELICVTAEKAQGNSCNIVCKYCGSKRKMKYPEMFFSSIT